MGKTVKFDVNTRLAQVPDLYLSGNTPAVHAIAQHITRKCHHLRPGKWFVQLAHNELGGYIGFYGSDDQIAFTIEAGMR